MTEVYLLLQKLFFSLNRKQKVQKSSVSYLLL